LEGGELNDREEEGKGRGQQGRVQIWLDPNPEFSVQDPGTEPDLIIFDLKRSVSAVLDLNWVKVFVVYINTELGLQFCLLGLFRVGYGSQIHRKGFKSLDSEVKTPTKRLIK
jgi:hypothetical protein